MSNFIIVLNFTVLWNWRREREQIVRAEIMTRQLKRLFSYIEDNKAKMYIAMHEV